MDKARLNAKLAAAVAAALGAPLGAEVAQAQEIQVEATGLEEVVVTARKREENLQDLGVAVSAMGQLELNRRFDVDLQDFANAAPNVVIDDLQQGPGSPAAIAIRGIGTTDVEKNFDPTVGVVLDGVFIGANSGAMLKALDLQSVEILRGPQGTLFGRNSIAGVINVTRQRPQTEFGGGARLGYGNYDDKQLDGFVNIPLGDQFAFKLSGAYRERDGYFDNLTLDRESGEMEYRSISPSLLWRPSDSLEFYYRYDRTDQDQDANTVQNMAQGDQVFCFFYSQCAQSVTTSQSGDRYDVLQNGDGRDSFFDTEMHVFNARWDLSDANRLEYVFGYFTTDEEVHQDWDATPLTLYHTDRPAVYTQRSHELRLTHDGDGALTYTVGAYAWNSNYRIDLLSFIGFVDFLSGGAVPPGTVVERAADRRAAHGLVGRFRRGRLPVQRCLDADPGWPVHEGREEQRPDRPDHAGARDAGRARQPVRGRLDRVHAQGRAALSRLDRPDGLRPVLEGLPVGRVQRPREHLRCRLQAV